MSPAVACTVIQKTFEYCFNEDNSICIANVMILYRATLLMPNLTYVQLEYANNYRRNLPVADLSLEDERTLYLILINILSM